VKRKVKKVVKEGEEKDSLLNEIKIKSQAAMEYLMTYGWAILIIALTLAVLYSLGIMNPKNFLPRAPPGSCFVFRPNGPGTTDYVSLQGTCGYLPMYVGSFNGVNAWINTSLLQNNVIAYTISAWVKTAKQQGVIVNDRGSGAGESITLAIAPSCGGAGSLCPGSSFGVPAVGLDSNGIWIGINAINRIDDNNWHHIVGVFNSTSGQSITPSNFKIYIDGKLQSGNSGSIGSATSPVTGLSGTRIAWHQPWGYYFNGLITNVQIYNTALTSQEIQYLYQQGLGGGPVRLQNLVAWWPLNGDAKDYSGNNNNGIIYGGVTFIQNYNPP
jgi:hypothetical protein